MLRFSSMRVALGTLICLLSFSFAAFCQQPAVCEITIESSWSGLGPSANLKLVIQSRGGKHYIGGEMVDSKQIEELLSALHSAPITTPQASNLGITRKWLEQYADGVPRNGAPNQEALFKENFTDLKTIEQLLPSGFKFWRWDDYPSMRVTVAFANGQRWVAASDSYYPFMLPWTVNLSGKEQTTYNADISRGIAALMPNGSLNCNRLNDEELKIWLADAVMTHVKEQWDFLGVENRAPESFATLRRHFEVEHARIIPYRSVDYGYIGNEPGPHEENLLATIRKPSLPPHIAEDVVLLFHDGKIEGVGELAETIAPYEALALSVPWLNRYLADHPEQNMYIRFVHDRSFSVKAMQNFAADMKKLGKEPLANEVATVQDKAALVFLDYGSDWVILPDKRMILWKHYLPASFLKWKATDFTFERCADYNANNGGCVGAIVSADGTLQR
ncbi:MAG: hypothetical protein ABSF92_14365 [Candidatus Acidiferrales bacterium]|jgi:hypothetical protein